MSGINHTRRQSPGVAGAMPLAVFAACSIIGVSGDTARLAATQSTSS